MQSFIIDSCSLMFSFQLRVNEIPLSDYLGAHFKMLVHREIVNELAQALPRAYSRWRERGLVSEDLSEIRRKHAVWLADKCTDVGLEAPMRLLDRENIEGIVRLDSGEKACLALAKLTSYEDTVYTLFLTDDYKAGECAQTLFDMYQCGLILRTADIILFFGLRYRCAKTEIHQALRDLLSFYTNIFESLLTEVELLLPQKDQAFIEALLKRGEFDAARTRLAAINLAPASRSKLQVLMDQVSELAGERSIIGYTLNRLRTLTAVAL